MKNRTLKIVRINLSKLKLYWVIMKLK